MRFPRAPRLLAAIALTMAASGGLVVTAPEASAAGSVAIVISYSGGVDVARCVPAGSSGDSILNSVASVVYRRDGLITQINSQPATPVANTTHYWAYFHDTGSGWTYSSVGPASYTPAAGTVEGWRYDNGSSSAPPPPSRSFASICGAPAPPATSAAAPPPAPAPATTTSAATKAPTRPATTATTSAASAASASAPVAGSSVPDPSSVTSAVPSVSVIASSPSTAASSIDATAVSHSSAAKTGSSGPAVPLIIAAVLVVALAAGAFVVARQRRAS